MFKTLIIFLILFSLPANAAIKINNWDEKITLNNEGKESELKIKAQVTNLQPNQYYKNFGFGFDNRQKITIKNVKFDNQNATYSFQNNSLSITFPQAKANNNQFEIAVSYAEKYDKITPYLRREIIYVPSWASGASTSVEVSYPWSLRSATLNKNIREFNKAFIYRGIVPKDGVHEVIKLTNLRNSWYVRIKNSIAVKGNILGLEAAIPQYFISSGQQQSSYAVMSNPAVPIVQKDNRYILKFENLKNQNIGIQIEAQIDTGENNNFSNNRNPSDYLTISDEDKLLLAPILQEITQNKDLQGLPLYAQIGSYVHDYIKYEKSLAGQLPNLKKIVLSKSGVCTEYAKLFNALARLAKIPSVIVNGVAYGEYNGFEGHAWNLIYYNNRWIYVDPTWDLMSGVVSSSHIYFHDDMTESIAVKWSSIIGTGNVDIGNNHDNDFEVKKIW